MLSKDKKNALDRAIKDIEKQFGKGSVMLMGDKEDQKSIEVISTGSLAVDIALTVGVIQGQSS
jgi:recombination protein RecA